MPHSPTDEQMAILNAATGTSKNLMIQALAGCGKSSTLEMIARNVKASPILYVAFGKRNVEEAVERMPSHVAVKTLNSIGHRIWSEGISKNKISVSDKKVGRIFKEVADSLKGSDRDDMWSMYHEIITGVAMAKAVGYVPEGKFPSAKRLMNWGAFNAELNEPLNDFAGDLLDEILKRSIVEAFDGNIDFNDQVYMPATFGGPAPRFPLVMVDEYQDLSPVNHALVAMLVRKRLIAVGDRHQCHPVGTKVFITGKGNVPIETINIKDKVAYFSTKEGRFVGCQNQGRNIEHIHVSDFRGNLIVVEVNNKVVKMTPNHKCMVRISRDANGHLLYLMRRGRQYRLGISRIRDYNNPIGSPFGPSLRARQERADAVWLLDVFDNEIVARAHEQYYSAVYGIPQTLFVSEKQQEGIDLLWELIGDNETRAAELLNDFNRDINLPYWKISDGSFIGFHRAGVVHACNLIPEIMTMLTYPDGCWHSINLNYEFYSGPVYGITVEHREESKRVYLANDVLVHNSIYAFRGAKASGMIEAKETYSMEEFPLSISFRCPEAIVAHARKHVPEFKSLKPGGEVHFPDSLVITSIPPEASILCRLNAPLFAMGLRLLSAGKSCQVVGKDIGPRLTKIMSKLGHESMTQKETLSAIVDWEAERLEAGSKIAGDMAASMRVFAGHTSTLGHAIQYATHLFKAEGHIKLMTGHKAKGLEFENVYHLDPQLCGKSRQDQNLWYVITTRSQNSLTEIASANIEDD